MGKKASAPCRCFVADTRVRLAVGSLPIQDVRPGDRVLAADVDAPDSAWIPVAGERAPSAGKPRLRRDALGHFDTVMFYEPRTGYWVWDLLGSARMGDEFVADGQLYRVTRTGFEARGRVAVDDLFRSDATWVPEELGHLPSAKDWVLVLGESHQAGHRRLSELSVDDERVTEYFHAFTPEGFSAVLYPELAYNFGNGLELGTGVLWQLGKPYTKFGAPEAGGDLWWFRGRYYF